MLHYEWAVDIKVRIGNNYNFEDEGKKKMVVIKNINVLFDSLIYWVSTQCAELFKQIRYPRWREEQKITLAKFHSFGMDEFKS